MYQYPQLFCLFDTLPFIVVHVNVNRKTERENKIKIFLNCPTFLVFIVESESSFSLSLNFEMSKQEYDKKFFLDIQNLLINNRRYIN